LPGARKACGSPGEGWTRACGPVAEGRSPVTDIVELIHAEHVRISKLVGKLDRALAEPYLADTGSEAGLIWAALARFLRLHVDAAEEIAYQPLANAGPDAVLAIVQASEANTEICEAVEEAGLSVPGSRTWHMAVQAACRAAQTHIACVESGPLTRYQLDAVPAIRQSLGRQWVFFVTARVLDASVRLWWPRGHQASSSAAAPECCWPAKRTAPSGQSGDGLLNAA
jgi:hypothetical protein